MGLWEFLRQWQGSRHVTGIALSVVVHVLLLAALFTNNPFFALHKPGIKPGDALIVDLRSEASPAAAGNASPPPTAAPRSPAAPAPAAAPPSPSVRRAPAKPAPVLAKPEPAPAKPEPAPVKPAQVQEPPSRVASAPPTPPVPPEPQPVAPPVTEAAGTMPVPAAAPAPPAPVIPPAPSAPADTAARTSEAPPSPSPPASGTQRQVASVPPAANAPAGQASVPDLRSLRPGGGGAHGSVGAGRGGIEGDPVALDTSDPRYGEYLARVKLAIERKMIYPCVEDPHGRICDHKQAQLLLAFGIKTDGSLAFIEVLQPAAYRVFDEASMNAVKLAIFPPMPETLRRIHPTGLPITANFRYITTYSLRSIIR